MQHHYGFTLHMARCQQRQVLAARKKRYADQHSNAEHTTAVFQRDDLALVQFPDHIHPPADGAKADGPVKVIERVGDNAYRLLHLAVGTPRVYSTSQMVRYHTNIFEPTPVSVAARSRSMWAVERIVEHKYDEDGYLLVLVKWYGWEEAANTWERAIENRHNSDIIEYCEARRLDEVLKVKKPKRRRC
jgi:hypothetical protein